MTRGFCILLHRGAGTHPAMSCTGMGTALWLVASTTLQGDSVTVDLILKSKNIRYHPQCVL